MCIIAGCSIANNTSIENIQMLDGIKFWNLYYSYHYFPLLSQKSTFYSHILLPVGEFSDVKSLDTNVVGCKRYPVMYYGVDYTICAWTNAVRLELFREPEGEKKKKLLLQLRL